MNIGDAIKQIELAKEHMDMYRALIGFLNEALPSDVRLGTSDHALAGFNALVIEDAIDSATQQLQIWEQRKTSFEELSIHERDTDTES